MNRTGIAFACALAAAPSVARAERQTIVTFSGGMSAIGPLEADASGEGGGPEDVGLQLRATMSWEDAPLPYKEPKGYVFSGTIVPEVFAGVITAGEDRSELVGGGLRLEIAFSQRRMGLLEVSARGGFYVAGRGGLFTDPDHTPFLEAAFGEYFLVGDSARLGFELGIMPIYASQPEEWAVGGALAGPPFDQGRGTYLNINACVYLGVVL